MKTKTKWIVTGGAAAFVLTPMAAFAGPSILNSDLGPAGVVVAANPGPSASAEPSGSPRSTAGVTPGAQASDTQTSTTQTSSTRASDTPASPNTPATVTPVSPQTPSHLQTAPSPVSAVTPPSPVSPRSVSSPDTP